MTNGKKLVISFTLSHGSRSDSCALVLVGYCEGVATAAAVVIIPKLHAEDEAEMQGEESLCGSFR